METISLLDHIKSFVDQAEKAGNIEKIRETIKFINDVDETDSFLNLEEAMERGLNLANYKKVVITVNPKEVLTSLLTNEEYIYKEDIVILEKAVKFAKKLVHSHTAESNDFHTLKQPESKEVSKSKKKAKK